MITLNPMREQIADDVSSVAEFLNRYYQPAKYRGRQDWFPKYDYAAEMLRRYEAEFKEYGRIMISRHDSTTGKTMLYFGA